MNDEHPPRLSPYGQRLDAPTYGQQSLALHQALYGAKGKAAAALRRRELDLTIDHRLGLDVPQAQRDALWRAQQRIERRKLPLLAMGLLRKALGATHPLEEPLYRLVLREYGHVLSGADLSAMVDLPPDQCAALMAPTPKGIFPPFDYRVPMPTGRPTPPTVSGPAPPSHPATKEQVKGDTLGRRLRWK
jgi:hypothetical protein